MTLSFILNQEFVGQGLRLFCGAGRAVTTCSAPWESGASNAMVLPTNYRAVLVLERCGFVKEGTIREGFLWPDKGIVDLTIYSLLPTDRTPKKKPAPPTTCNHRNRTAVLWTAALP